MGKNIRKNEKESLIANISTDISKDEIKKIIIEAYFEIEKQKEKIVKKESTERLKEIALFEINNRYKIIRFFKLSKLYLNKKESDGRLTLTWMAMLLSMIFTIIAISCGVLSIILICVIIDTIITMTWDSTGILNNFLRISSTIAVTIFLLVFGIFSYCTSKEVEKEKDKNYLSSVFSGIVGFVALIIAFVALIK